MSIKDLRTEENNMSIKPKFSQCMYFTSTEFSEVIKELFDADVEYSLDGIWLGDKKNGDEISQEELYEKLAECFNVAEIVSIHSDNWESVGVWVEYNADKTHKTEEILTLIKEKNIVVFYAENEENLNFINQNVQVQKIETFDTYAEFIEHWFKLYENPISKWYEVYFTGERICCGAIDPTDIGIFEENDHFDDEKISLKEFYNIINKPFTEKYLLKNIISYAKTWFDTNEELHVYLNDIFADISGVSVADIYRTKVG